MPKTERSRPSAFWILAAGVMPLVGLVTRLQIIDGRRLPRTGAVVVAPNHYTEIDPLVVGAVCWRLGRLPRFLTKASLFRVPVVGRLLAATGQIPVARTGASRGGESLKAARILAETGRMVIVYPEGSLTRDPDMWPMRGKTGAVRIALERDIPLIPVAHWGAQDVLARYGKRVHVFPPRRIRVKFGDPVDLSGFRGRPLDPHTLNEATEVLMDAITALLEDLRGERAPRERWNPAAHDQRETGRFES